MHFAPDVEDTLEFTAVLCNTVPSASRSGTDEVLTIAQLHALLDANSYGGTRNYSEAERRSVADTRLVLRALWTLDRNELAGAINVILREANALPQLTRHNQFDWHIHAIPLDAPLVDRIRVEVALALVDVIRADATDRLRMCEAHDCEGLLIDLSRNGSRRFCSIRCGNRMNMIAYRERQLATLDA